MDETKKSKLIKLTKLFAGLAILVIVIQKAALWMSYARRAEARRNASVAVSTNDSVELRMHAAALVAIATVEPEARRPFNFSPESLQNVDDMLHRLPQMVSQTNRDEELYYACVAWGAYIGEVLRTQHKSATWSEDGEAEGGEVYAVRVGGQTIYPCLWAIDRLEKGESANVWRRYQNISQIRDNTEPDGAANAASPHR
jgi:hypothetical protein